VTSGQPAAGFGKEGLLDLSEGVLDPGLRGRVSLRSPPAVYGNIVITGSVNGEGAPSKGAYGDVRG
jgi:quinoprotein glucose dehydrogenase